MIISRKFAYDPIWVQKLQYELYFYNYTPIFRVAKRKYLLAEEIIGIKSQLGYDCQRTYEYKFDHRITEGVHDALAAKFRYENRNRFETPLPGVLEELSHEIRIKRDWIDYFKEEINNLLDEQPGMVRQIVIAATYPDPDQRGILAMQSLDRYCDNIYQNINDEERALLLKYMYSSSE